MGHRERVLAALSHEVPDRVPIDVSESKAAQIHGEAYMRLVQCLGWEDEYDEVKRNASRFTARLSQRFLEPGDLASLVSGLALDC